MRLVSFAAVALASLAVLSSPRSARADEPAKPPSTVATPPPPPPPAPSDHDRAGSAAPRSDDDRERAATARRARRSAIATPTPEDEVEIITLEGSEERDRQWLAFGLHAGAAYLNTRGSGAGAGAGSFAFVVDLGLGPGFARVPWSAELFTSFAVTSASIISGADVHPNRFTEIGGRVVYRFQQGLLRDRWLGLGGGAVWTSWGQGTTNGDLTPAPLIDLSIGVQEWVARTGRLGIALRTPFEFSSHAGGGAVAVFYGQLGIGG